jgi:hypothetical protein
VALSIEDSLSWLMPSVVTWSARLISTARGEVAYDTVSTPSPEDLVRALDTPIEDIVPTITVDRIVEP